MAISELQIALIGAGAAAVAMVWGYNAWQDRQHRKTADRIFKDGQDDALLDGQPVAKAAPEDGNIVRRGPVERLEPHISPEAEALADQSVGPADEVAAPAQMQREPMQQEQIDGVDTLTDCVLRLTMADPVPAPSVLALQSTWSGDLTRPVQWLARNEATGTWAPLRENDTGRYREWAVTLQLVDRRGPVSDAELGRYFEGVQTVATQTRAVLDLPSRGEVLLRAGRLDQYCAGVDIQFVLHVVEGMGGIFAGSKLRGVAEAAGLTLEADGVFRAHDATGGEMFSVANIGAERLDPESIKSMATHGLTLSLDVPRVGDGVQAFDMMLTTARQLAAALGGELVDAQRAPLSLAMIDAIRAKTAELQKIMRDGSIIPGSPRALRLFS